MAIKNVTILQEQSLFDVVLQYYGDVTKVYDFIKLNPTISSVMYNNLKGLTVNYEEQTNQIANYFSSAQKDIATKNPQFAVNPFDESFYLSVEPLTIMSLQK